MSEQDDGPCDFDRVIANHIRRIFKKTARKIHEPGGEAELVGLNALSFVLFLGFSQLLSAATFPIGNCDDLLAS